MDTKLDAAVAAMFAPADIQAASSRLADMICDGSFPSPDVAERVCAAALKTSGGSLGRLEDMLELARKDWRDLLMAAGFGDDLAAHEVWLDQIGKPSS